MSHDTDLDSAPADGPTLDLPRWRDAPRWCGRARPGVGQDNTWVMDYTERESTEDQRRIEDVLEPRLRPDDRLLHVGTGNSMLARRFATRVAAIVGLTLSADELRHGASLGIANYRVLQVNKYTPALASLPGPFDYIIDNNPASFACCVGHFQVMLDAYAALLRPGGLMVTDQQGLDWCYADGPMTLDFDDLELLCDHYPFRARRLSGQVVALQRRRD